MTGKKKGKKGKRSGSRGKKKRRPRKACPFELKLKAVKLFVEKGYPAELVAREVGISKATLFDWAKQYREGGEAGLKPKGRGHRAKNISPVVKEKITAAKESHPGFGIKRLSQFLKRVMCIPASPETVRKTLKEAETAEKPPQKPKAKRKRRKAQKPKVRFFERAKPNQLWQSDITVFQAQGRPAYLIGFMDDYSRYIVGLKVCRSQRASDVIETYRTAVGNCGLPQEVLTDNGRQYVSWRGRSRFEKELKKDDVKHIRSATHHPQTLGKLERFWKSIKDELISRATFETFEDCQERVAMWVKYYNHQRPHQGIKGACPADRFFLIQHRLREVIEREIEENLQELAVHGRVKDPFYLVGRMGTKSVVIRSENGEVKLSVDEEGGDGHGEEKEGQEEAGATERGAAPDVQCTGEGRGGALSLDGAPEAGGSAAGDGDPLHVVEQLAECSDGSDAYRFRAAGAPGGGPAAGVESEAGEAAEAETSAAGGERDPDPAAADECGIAEGESREKKVNSLGMPLNGYALLPEGALPIVEEVLTEKAWRQADERQEEEPQRAGSPGPQAGGDGHPGLERTEDGIGGGQAAGSEPEDVLQVGETVPVGDAGGGEREGSGASGERGRQGEGAASAAGKRAGKTGPDPEADGTDPGSSAAEVLVAGGPCAEEATGQETAVEAGRPGSGAGRL